MSSLQPTFESQLGASPLVLKPNPRRFLVRTLPWVLIALFLYGRVAGGTAFSVMFMLGGGMLWLAFKRSSLTLNSEGFTYRGLGKHTTVRWVDVERFSVVNQKMYGFITINRFLGWNYSPAYKNYKRLAIPRALARFVGMTHAMIKPYGFDVKELTVIMNHRLAEAHARNNR